LANRLIVNIPKLTMSLETAGVGEVLKPANITHGCGFANESAKTIFAT